MRGRLLYTPKKNRRSTLTEITNSGANEVSICTVRKALKNAGLNSRIAKKKPFLKESHIKNRREFVKNYSSWTMDEWKNVIWTDESSIELGHNSRQVRVWRNEEDAYLEECLVPTFKSGRSSIMVWGAIAWGKKSELVVLEKGRRTASDFVDQVYEGGLLRFLEGFSTPILMEDGAPIHRAIVAKNWRESHGVTKMVWPAQSPDMNPIENLWKILKDEVQKRFQQGMSLETYKDVVIEAWNSIEIEKINSLIEGVPGRLECLKKTRGGSTRF